MPIGAVGGVGFLERRKNLEGGLIQFYSLNAWFHDRIISRDFLLIATRTVGACQSAIEQGP